MADLKISQLPETTAPVGTDIIPLVNSGQTRRATINNINSALPITSFVQSTSGSWLATSGIVGIKVGFQSGFTNFPNNTDTFIPWTGVEYNTGGIGSFQLVNASTAQARVLITTPGYYLFSCDGAFFDLYGNLAFNIKLYQSTGSTTSMSYLETISRRWWVGSTIPPAQFQSGVIVRQVLTANQYYTIAVLPTPGAGFAGNAGGPFPAVIEDRPTALTIVKLA